MELMEISEEVVETLEEREQDQEQEQEEEDQDLEEDRHRISSEEVQEMLEDQA